MHRAANQFVLVNVLIVLVFLYLTFIAYPASLSYSPCHPLQRSTITTPRLIYASYKRIAEPIYCWIVGPRNTTACVSGYPDCLNSVFGCYVPNGDNYICYTSPTGKVSIMDPTLLLGLLLLHAGGIFGTVILALVVYRPTLFRSPYPVCHKDTV